MKKSTLSDSVYLALKEHILEMNSGDFLSIRQCAAKYAMSYTPVREAVLRLNEEGFLRKIPGVGYFANDPDYFDFCQVYQVRKCIEPYALDQVFFAITAQETEMLEQLDRKINEARDNRNSEVSLQLDIEFHGFFVKKCGNEYLQNLYYTARERYKNLLIKSIDMINLREVETAGPEEGHRFILDCIRKHDQERALKALNSHIDKACQRMLNACQHR